MFLPSTPAEVEQDPAVETLRAEALEELNAELVKAGNPPLIRLPYPSECMKSHPNFCLFGTAVGGRCGYSRDGDDAPIGDPTKPDSGCGVWVAMDGTEMMQFASDSAVAKLSKMFDRGELGGEEHRSVSDEADYAARRANAPDLWVG